MILRVLTLLLSLQLAHYPTGQDPETPGQRSARFHTLAEAITLTTAKATCEGQPEGCAPIWGGTQEELAALLVTEGWYESKFILRVHQGRCRQGECDAGRAKSPWQVQPSEQVPWREWRQLEGTALDATTRASWAAAKVLGASRARCAATGQWEAFTVSAYATGRCRRWSGAEARVRLYRKLLRAMTEE